MKKYYIVCETHVPEECLELVSAETQEELEDKAFEALCDDIFIEHVNSMVINAGLLEIFFKDENGSFFDNMTGGVREGASDDYIDSCVCKNVIEFFRDKPEFAELYLNQYFSNAAEKFDFPREMYKFIFFHYNYTSYIIKEVTI